MKKKNKKKEEIRSMMNDKEFKNYIKKLFQNNLDQYIIHDFTTLNFNFTESCQCGKPLQFVFCIDFSRPYHDAMVTITPIAYKMYKEGKLEELKKGALHELCHIHTIPLGDMAQDRFITKKEIQDEVEHLTEVIKNYILTYERSESTKALSHKALKN